MSIVIGLLFIENDYFRNRRNLFWPVLLLGVVTCVAVLCIALVNWLTDPPTPTSPIPLITTTSTTAIPAPPGVCPDGWINSTEGCFLFKNAGRLSEVIVSVCAL